MEMTETLIIFKSSKKIILNDRLHNLNKYISMNINNKDINSNNSNENQ